MSPLFKSSRKFFRKGPGKLPRKLPWKPRVKAVDVAWFGSIGLGPEPLIRGPEFAFPHAVVHNHVQDILQSPWYLGWFEVWFANGIEFCLAELCLAARCESGGMGMQSIAWGFLVLVCLMLNLGQVDAETEPSPEQLRFFETSIRPLLVEKCQGCHGVEKQWGNLRLDSRAAILRGGELGAAIIPGKPDESLLIKAIRRTDDAFQMPPKESLTERQIADLVRWVEMGAPFPVEAGANTSRHRDPNHWSFRSRSVPVVPPTADGIWASGPWDQFILQKLEAAQVVPTAKASRRTLLRRATFDLTGLPPTPGEIADFLSDERPDAFSRLIDRLLASPSYGERWARHWLDVARYADSNGLDENVAYGNAWRYRDYVVAAFNQDLPYDQFLIEQLAGDLVPAENDEIRTRRLTATGFLALGPKVLAEVDATKMEMDIIDEQIDTFGRAVLGLTLGCARCHDHKFDPIETADYYGLAGIFKSTRTMEHFRKVARWHENSIPTPEARAIQAAFALQLSQKKGIIQAVIEKADQVLKATLAEGETEPAQRETKYPDAVKDELKRLREELIQLEKTVLELPTAMGVSEESVVDVAIHIRGNPLKLGEVIPRRVPGVLAKQIEPKFNAHHSGRMEMAQWLVNPQHSLTSRVFVNRVWRWHFGKGLVRTPDNFGLLGELPTHPELLDRLANDFVRSGWSLKALHRQLLDSSTYQLESELNEASRNVLERDPENRLFGRAEIQRLEAEAVRDALIAVGEGLDRRVGQSLLTVKNRAYFFDHTSKDLTDYRSHRRSIYLPVVRNNVYDVFQLLDYPDAAVPNGDRPTTTIAPQALLMMNSEFVEKCSADLADTLFEERLENDEERIRRAYLRAYGREALPAEVTESLSFLGEIRAELMQAAATGDRTPERVWDKRAWESLCHVMLISNEFIYIK